MLSHSILVSNVYQLLGPNAALLVHDDVMLCFLPLYHIYGLTVALTTSMAIGSQLILMPRFDVQKLTNLVSEHGVTMMPMVPPAINALCQATATVMRDGWYYSGDIVRADGDKFFYVLDRRKEMIKYNGFPVAPAEVEAVLLEHPGVRDCGVVAKPDRDAGEIPCAFVVLREGSHPSEKMKEDLCGFVAERLTHYKQPR